MKIEINISVIVCLEMDNRVYMELCLSSRCNSFR